MNKYELIPTTYLELKILRTLVESSRDLLRVNGVKATLELESLKEKLDAAARRFKQREYQELKERR